MQFQPPSWMRPRDYSFIPQGIQDIFNSYAQALQMRKANEQRDTSDLMQYGFTTRGRSQYDPLVQEFLARKKEAQGLEIRSKESEIQKNLATAEKDKRTAGTGMGEFGPAEDVEIGGKHYLRQDMGPGKPPRYSPVNERQPADFRNEATLRSELQKLSGDFIKIRDSHARVNASAKDPSPAGDLAMLYNYMKILDPGSVVRESEFAAAAQTGAFGERMKAAVGKVTSGERLSADMRKDFVDRANELYNAQANRQRQTEQNYRTLAEGYGLQPERIAVSLGSGDVNMPQPDPGAASALAARRAAFIQKHGISQ